MDPVAKLEQEVSELKESYKRSTVAHRKIAKMWAAERVRNRALAAELERVRCRSGAAERFDGC